LTPDVKTGGLLSREQARAYLGIGSTMLWKLEQEGQVHAVRIGRRVLFRPEDLDAFVVRCRESYRRESR
jgi:excisionase family DNA binding protein